MSQPTSPRFVIERLAAHHDRQSFACGTPALDRWLREQAGQHDRRDLARTFVAVRPGDPRVCGYYAVASHHVRHEALSSEQAKGLPRHVDVPVVLLARLAVDRSVQGQGLGSSLLIDALRRTLALADQLGIRAVEVDAIDDAAVAFYQRYGFSALSDAPRHLYLPLAAVRKLGLVPRAADEEGQGP